MDDPTLWSTMILGESRDWVMTAGSGKNKDGEVHLSSSGLIGNHSYSLLAAYEVKRGD